MNQESIKILLADDDKDDCFFFSTALDSLPVATTLTTVSDGEKLMEYLGVQSPSLTDVLFLDLNMPRKNGFECLTEIKNSDLLRGLPVIIFSTSYEKEVVSQLYLSGAHFFIRKPAEYSQYEKIIHHAVGLLTHGRILPTGQENFVLSLNHL